MEKKNFVIACDMDDTLTNLVTPWINWLNSRYNLDVDPAGKLEWNMEVQYPTLTREEIFEPLFTKEFWETVTPIEDSVIYVKKLIDEGFTIYLCTASNYKTLKYKFNKVLFKYFPFFDKHNIIVTYNKQLIRCNVLIDDGTHNIVGPYYGLLVDTTYNRWFDESKHDNITRVHSWKEIYNEIHRLYSATK